MNLEQLKEVKTTKELANTVSHMIYKHSCKIFEYLENEGIIGGNGHHDAQRLALLAEYLIFKKSKLKKDDKEIEQIKKTFKDFMI